MYFNIKQRIGDLLWRVFTPEGKAVDGAFAADTKEGWYEAYVLDEAGRPTYGSDGGPVTAKYFVPFVLKNQKEKKEEKVGC